MKILLLGSGGREHALAWKMVQSPLCEQLFIAPGNAGTAQVGTNIAIGGSDFEAQLKVVNEHGIDLIVVGPEQPLVDGCYDYFTEKGIAVIGPSQAAAELEGSKAFSKTFMQSYGIPTAAYGTYEQEQVEEAVSFAKAQSLPVVVKASGLAAGKGVLICETHEEAEKGIREMLSGEAFGGAGSTVVIEEFLKGIEISIFVLTDGKDYVILPSAKDYKRIGEGDAGLNTGGMGAVSPVPFADEAFLDLVEKTIVKPTVDGIQDRGMDYKGFIFIGLMVVDGKPYVLEYNVRMGDPETEVVIPRLQTDMVELFIATRDQQLADKSLELDPRTCTTVMLVSGGYPEAYEKGKVMTGWVEKADSIYFHAGTKAEDDQIKTNGGRVLAISSFGESISEAVNRSLELADQVEFDGKYFRRDIGQDLM